MAVLLMPVDLKPVHISAVDASFAHGGVYFLYLYGVIVYVGQSGSVRRRVGEHLSDHAKAFDSVAFIPCQALNRQWMEAQYIERFRPIYNGMTENDARRLSGWSGKRRRRRHRKQTAQAA